MASEEFVVVSSDGIQDYFERLRHHPVLTAAQEASLCRQIEVGVLAREAAATAEPNRERLRDLLTLAREGDVAFRDMVHGNLRLVVAAARKYRDRNVPFADLIQDGNMGLLRAIQGFDVQRGFRFSTYAMFWIREYIEQGITRQAHVIKVPHHQLARLASVRKMWHELETVFGHETTLDELALAVDVERGQLDALLVLDRPTASLQAPIAEGLEFGDVLSDDGARDPLELAIEAEEISALGRALAALGEREREVIARTYGLGGSPVQIPREIARSLTLKGAVITDLLGASLEKLANDEALAEAIAS